MARKTKIVCTLGPACWSEEGLASLLDAGLNVARFNFSHGDHEGHYQVLERLRKVRNGQAARDGLLAYVWWSSAYSVYSAAALPGDDAHTFCT